MGIVIFVSSYISNGYGFKHLDSYFLHNFSHEKLRETAADCLLPTPQFPISESLIIVRKCPDVTVIKCVGWHQMPFHSFCNRPHLFTGHVRSPAFDQAFSISGCCHLLPAWQAPAEFLIFVFEHFGEMCTLQAASCDLTPDFHMAWCVLGQFSTPSVSTIWSRQTESPPSAPCCVINGSLFFPK